MSDCTSSWSLDNCCFYLDQTYKLIVYGFCIFSPCLLGFFSVLFCLLFSDILVLKANVGTNKQ